MAIWDIKCTASPHTHTNLYLKAKSHLHPSNEQAVLSTLIHRAIALCDEDNLQAELVFPRDVFKQNDYNDRQIHRALNRRPHLYQPDLPFVGTIFNRIGRVLAGHNIKSVGFPHMKLSSLLRPVKDHLELRTSGVYRIPCDCGRVYIGQTGRSMDIRLKEHQRHILATKTRYMDRIVREAIELELQSCNINRGSGFCLSKSWKPLIGSLKLTQGHLATWFRNHNVLTNNPALPFYRSLGPHFEV
jgi:hypothetical protein